jgi:hypothetical protein
MSVDGLCPLAYGIPKDQQMTAQYSHNQTVQSFSNAVSGDGLRLQYEVYFELTEHSKEHPHIGTCKYASQPSTTFLSPRDVIYIHATPNRVTAAQIPPLGRLPRLKEEHQKLGDLLASVVSKSGLSTPQDPYPRPGNPAGMDTLIRTDVRKQYSLRNDEAGFLSVPWWAILGRSE